MLSRWTLWRRASRVSIRREQAPSPRQLCRSDHQTRDNWLWQKHMDYKDIWLFSLFFTISYWKIWTSTDLKLIWLGWSGERWYGVINDEHQIAPPFFSFYFVYYMWNHWALDLSKIPRKCQRSKLLQTLGSWLPYSIGYFTFDVITNTRRNTAGLSARPMVWPLKICANGGRKPMGKKEFIQLGSSISR